MQSHFTRRRAVLVAALGLACQSANAQAPDRSISVQEIQSARQAAERVLALMDKAPLSKFEFDDFYANAGEALRKRYSPAAFSHRMASVRPALGIKSERTFYGYSGPYATLPNLISGDYVIVAFHTRFGQSQQLFTEQVTLENDRGGRGRWNFVEYYSAPIAATEEVQ